MTWLHSAEDIKGFFNGNEDPESEMIKYLVGNFHYRDGFRHEDGSLGSIKISPEQLRDTIAYAIQKSKELTKNV